jgi:hypothetical protein
MVDKVNGAVAAGEALGRDLHYFSLAITGNLDIAAADAADAAAAKKLREKLIEVISLNGQPVILGSFAGTLASSPTLKFAVEHMDAWSKASLEAAIAAHCKVIHADDGVVGLTAVATLTNTL